MDRLMANFTRTFTTINKDEFMFYVYTTFQIIMQIIFYTDFP